MIIVTNTLLATAGSWSIRSSITGTITPASPAVRMLTSTAVAITPPSSGFENTSAVATPISVATVAPLSIATRNSRHRMRRVLLRVSWLVASARTVTAMVWVPALPPIEATIGESAASAISFSIAPPK